MNTKFILKNGLNHYLNCVKFHLITLQYLQLLTYY
jgi:hypothetical protein